MAQSADDGNKHFLKLFTFPKHVHLFSFAEDVLEIKPVLDVLAHNANSERVIHGFIEEITVELDDVRVVLGLEKLHCFFLSQKG